MGVCVGGRASVLSSSKRIYVCLKKAVILLWQKTENLLNLSKALSSLLDSLIVVFAKLIKYPSTPSSSSSPGLLTHHHGLLLLWVLTFSPLDSSGSSNFSPCFAESGNV